MVSANGTGWAFLTNHAHVLLCISQTPDARVRDIAEKIGITERATHRILGELVKAGYVSVKKVGRRNTYEVHPELPFRHPLQKDQEIGKLLKILG